MAAGRLEGKVSVVTGAARGFGQGIAAKFAKEGSKVVVVDVLEEAGQAVADEIGGKFVKADVLRRADWERILAETLRAFGQLDVVVNNAGTTHANKPAEEVTEDDFDLVMRVNVKSVYLSSVVVVPYMVERERPGVFVQVASTGAIRPRVRLTWYNASKAAAVGATKALAVEYAARRIRFNAVSPSVGATPLTATFIGKEDTPENMAPFLATVPLGRPSLPADVANACCYLASDEADFVTGVNLEVDGGRCI